MPTDYDDDQLQGFLRREERFGGTAAPGPGASAPGDPAAYRPASPSRPGGNVPEASRPEDGYGPASPFAPTGGFAPPDPSARSAEPGPAPVLGGPQDATATPTAADGAIPPAPAIDGPGGPPPAAGTAAAAGAIPALGRRRAGRDREGRQARDGRGRTRDGRRVHQRLWSVDPWSVFKVSAMFYGCVLIIVMVAGTLLWNVARSSGTVDSVESFVSNLGAYGNCVAEGEVPEGTEFETDDDCDEGEVQVGGFEIDDGTVFRSLGIAGVVLAVFGSIGNVLLVVLLNLINEVSGGMRYTIIKDGSDPARSSRRGGGGGDRAAALKALGGSLKARVRR